MNFLFIRKIIKIGDQWLYITCLKSISLSSNLGWSSYQVLIKQNLRQLILGARGCSPIFWIRVPGHDIIH